MPTQWLVSSPNTANLDRRRVDGIVGRVDCTDSSIELRLASGCNLAWALDWWLVFSTDAVRVWDHCDLESRIGFGFATLCSGVQVYTWRRVRSTDVVVWIDTWRPVDSTDDTVRIWDLCDFESRVEFGFAARCSAVRRRVIWCSGTC
jgi:hypothetical protein